MTKYTQTAVQRARRELCEKVASALAPATPLTPASHARRALVDRVVRAKEPGKEPIKHVLGKRRSAKEKAGELRELRPLRRRAVLSGNNHTDKGSSYNDDDSSSHSTVANQQEYDEFDFDQSGTLNGSPSSSHKKKTGDAKKKDRDIENILDVRFPRTGIEYEVKWAGLATTTWEHGSRLYHVKGLLAQSHERRRRAHEQELAATTGTLQQTKEEAKKGSAHKKKTKTFAASTFETDSKVW